MKICIDRFAGTVTRVMILFENSGRFVTLYERKKAVKIERLVELPPLDCISSIQDALPEEWKKEIKGARIRDELLRESIERGLREYENERRGIPKGYKCNFPPSSRVHVFDDKGSGISCCNGGKGGHSQ